MQLADEDVIDSATGRVDKERMGPEQLLQVNVIRQTDRQSLTFHAGCPKVASSLQACPDKWDLVVDTI